MDQKTFDSFFEIETTFNGNDVLIKETYFYKNELESRIYDYKEKLDSEWAIYTNNAESVQNMMQKRIDW